MRPLFIVLLLVAMSAIGVYAASEDPTGSANLAASDWGCTGSLAISSPSSNPVSVDWDLTKDGMVEAARFNWTPSSYGEYTLSVDLGQGSGLLDISEAGASPRTDIVPVNPAVPAAAMSLAGLSIAQRLDAATDLALSVGWLFNPSGQVTGAEVMWEPEIGSNYELQVTLGSGTGSTAVQNPGSSVRTDTISLFPPVPAESADSANLCINKL